MEALNILSPELIESFENEGYKNRPVAKNEIQNTLEAHGNGWHIVNDVLFAGSLFNDEDIANTTNWTFFHLLSYLNY